MLYIVSPIQDMLATFPSRPVIMLVSLLSLVSVVKSPSPPAYSPVLKISFASTSLYSPAYAVALILPAGTTYDHSPFSSESVYPIGTQYVSESSSSEPSPEKASLSSRILTFGSGCPSSDIVTFPFTVAPG